MVNVEAEVEKKYREKILYKNISGLSKCTGTGTTWTKLCSKRKLPLQGNFKKKYFFGDLSHWVL